jgi:uncharacterized protein YcfJ
MESSCKDEEANMKNIISGFGLVVVMAALAPTAYAGQPWRDHGRHDYPPRIEHGRVIHVEPVVHRTVIMVPAHDRRPETVVYRKYSEPRRDAAGAMIVGGLIGGILGHQLGGGQGKDAATVAGALIGAALARDAAGHAAVTRYDTVYEEHGRSESHRQVVEYVDGYRVSHHSRGYR